MDKSTKNKLWLMVIIAFTIIGMLLTIIINQALPFLSSKKNNVQVNNTIELNNEAEGYTYLKEVELNKANLLTKDEQRRQLDIERFQNNIQMKKYLTGISKIDLLNNYLIEPVDEKSILSLLDDNYKNTKEINSNNIKDFAGEYTFVPFGASLFNKNSFSEIFIYYGYRINELTETAEDYGYIIRFCDSEGTFSVAPYEFQELKDVISKNEIDTQIIIKLNQYNQLILVDDTPEICAAETLKIFKNNANYIPVLAYEELEEEYAHKFGSAKAFSTYIEKNEEKFEEIEVVSVTKKEVGGEITYSCNDKNKNSFYIRTNENDFFDFKIKFSNIIL